MSLPLTGYHSVEHYVGDLERARRYYCDVLGFRVIGHSSAAAQKRDGMERLVLAGGPTIHVILSCPRADHSVAALYLAQHPEGVGFLNFRVSDVGRAWRYLEPRGATFLYEVQTSQDDRGTFRQFAMASALDDVNYRMIEDTGYRGMGPGFDMDALPGSYASPYGFQSIDHITCNARTLQPLVAFYRDVLGFEEFWGISFHTNDVNPALPVGSGLRSKVMWHRESGIKFANNEPLRPFFRNSQIDIYCRDNRGSGVQHLAFMVPKITDVVSTMARKGASFLPATEEYYERTPARLRSTGYFNTIREDMAVLKKDSILVDANEKGYLLQIFTHELGRQMGDPRGGTLFFEIIQREGNDGFGDGNFRALFETIEHDQIAMEKTAKALALETL